MDRDAVGARLREGLDLISGPLDHQVDVQRTSGGVHPVCDRARHEGADRDRRDEPPVHDVDVDHPRACGHHLVDLLAEAREVGG